MKGINCCGDCANYNMRKHKCNICTDDSDPRAKFYADCPLPDVVEVRHGEWLYKNNPCYSPFDNSLSQIPICNQCGYEAKENGLNYCPICGAIMDGGVDND